MDLRLNFADGFLSDEVDLPSLAADRIRVARLVAACGAGDGEETELFDDAETILRAAKGAPSHPDRITATGPAQQGEPMALARQLQAARHALETGTQPGVSLGGDDLRAISELVFGVEEALRRVAATRSQEAA